MELSSKRLDLPSVQLEHRLGRKGHAGGTAPCLDSQPRRQVWGGIQGTTKVPGTFKAAASEEGKLDVSREPRGKGVWGSGAMTQVPNQDWDRKGAAPGTSLVLPRKWRRDRNREVGAEGRMLGKEGDKSAK